MRTRADMKRWASVTITCVRITPISAASWRSAKPSTAYAAASTRQTASTRAVSVSVVSLGVIRRSAYVAKAPAMRATELAPATTRSERGQSLMQPI
ncbi:hypothetical protein GCM10012286_80280 [Streptomyces lasiicapitis]|uniref:Secreted protein n=1 Tax=Streptomyces lasiicapitis TaxID=1923961 RepID=A0ABQ2MV30_9ACTN|nr:hypothetical protein GCM10012286_80280 [Streptomyces lasiicapitis]